MSDIIIGIAQDKGLEELYVYVQRSNLRMLKVCKKLGFTIEKIPDQMEMAKLKVVLK